MKKLFFIYCTLLLLASAYAQDTPMPPEPQAAGLQIPLGVNPFPQAPDSALKSKPSSFNIALETSSYIYKEPTATSRPRHEGMLYGLSFDYTHKNLFPKTEEDAVYRTFVRLEGRYLQGNMDYESTAQKINNINEFLAEGRAMLGLIYYPAEAFQLQPYIGIGVRYYETQADKKANSAYRRDTFYVYAPIGIKGLILLPKQWSLTLSSEYNWFWMGKHKARLSDISSQDYSNVTVDQDSGYGLRFGVKAQKQYKTFAVSAEPFFRYWHIRKSEEKALFNGGINTGDFAFEPYNETIEWGARIGISF